MREARLPERRMNISLLTKTLSGKRSLPEVKKTLEDQGIQRPHTPTPWRGDANDSSKIHQ
jgi:hypothetical protein